MKKPWRYGLGIDDFFIFFPLKVSIGLKKKIKRERLGTRGNFIILLLNGPIDLGC